MFMDVYSRFFRYFSIFLSNNRNFFLDFRWKQIIMPGTTVKDVDQDKIVQGVALFLKKSGKLKVKLIVFELSVIECVNVNSF